MKGTTITLERMAHVASESVNRLLSSRVDEDFVAEVAKVEDSYVQTDDFKEVTIEDVAADARGRNPYVAVWFAGTVTFRLNTGWGEKSMKDWRIAKKDLARLREHAIERGFKVAVKNTRGKKKRATKRPKKLPPEQQALGLLGSLLSLLLSACGSAYCERDPAVEVAPLTDCQPEELDIDGCGPRFFATCRDTRYLCRIDWTGEYVECREVPL
jgi:hypothetical protein